jgi:hypothetical protein
VGCGFQKVTRLPSCCCICPQGHGGSLLPPIVATWAVGLLAAMAGLAAPDAAALAEQLTGTAATD